MSNPAQPPIDPHAVNAMFKKADAPADAPPPAPLSDTDKTAMETMTKNLPNLLWGNPPKEKPPEKKEEPPKKEEQPKVEPPKAGEPPKEGEAPKAPEPAEKPKRTKKSPDAMEIAKVVGETIASKLNQPAPAAPTPPAADPTANLSEDDRYSYKVLQEMAEAEPDKYKSKPHEFLEYAKEFDKYKTRWEQQNPGQAFDMEADEHADFFEKHEPDFNDADFRRAETRLEYKRIHQKDREEFEERIRKAELKATIPQVQQQAQAIATESANKYLSNVLPKEGDKPVELVKLKEIDPITHDIIIAHQKHLGDMVTEIHKIAELGSDYFNPNLPIHRGIAEFINAQEAQVRALPAEQQINEGKMFATLADFSAMPEKEKARHWTLEEQDFIMLAENYYATFTNRTVEAEKNKLKTFAERYGYAPKAAQNGTPPPAPSPDPASPKPVAPSGGGGGALPPTSGSKTSEVKDLPKALVGSLWGS